MEIWLRKHILELELFLFVWVVYCLHVVPGGGVNPNRYFDLMHSLSEQGTLTIDAYHENTIDKAYLNGHYYSAGLPGPSLAGMPALGGFKLVYSLVPSALRQEASVIQSYKQGSATGFYSQDTTYFFLSTIWVTWFSLSMFSALGTSMLFLCCTEIGIARKYALAAALVYAFGTPVFFFSTTFFAHAFSTSLVCVILYVLARLYKDMRPGKVFVLGLLSGATLLVEYWGLVVIVVVGGFILRRFGKKNLLLFASGLVPSLLALMTYNALAFGNPFSTAYRYMVGENWDRVHSVGWLGFTAPTPDRFWGLTFSWEHGIFLYAPVLLLAFVGLYRGIRSGNPRKRDFSGLAVLCSAGILVAVACYEEWWGSVSFGPRQILIAVPFLALGAALAFERVPAMVWVPLAGLSIFGNWLGAMYGFAPDVGAHWVSFARIGFRLPLMESIQSHSRGDNVFREILSTWNIPLALIYFTLVGLGAGILFFSLRATAAGVPARQGGGTK